MPGPEYLLGFLGLRLYGASSQPSRRQPHCCLVDDRQRRGATVCILRGELCTAFLSARPGGESLAGCGDRPTKRKCRTEAGRMDWGTAEPFAGIGRLLRLALALIWVRAEQRDSAAVGRRL